MESLELWAKITLNAILLGGSYDIDRKNIDKLINLRSYYHITGNIQAIKSLSAKMKGNQPINKRRQKDLKFIG